LFFATSSTCCAAQEGVGLYGRIATYLNPGDHDSRFQ
jgi:hypothetical protein